MGGFIFLGICILAVAIFVDYLIAKEFHFIAKEKGYYESKYFHYCFWLGMLGYLIVIALPNQQKVVINTSHARPTIKKEELPDL